MPTPAHLDWLVDTGERLTSADGVEVEVWELQHADDATVLSAWAKHFRKHYCDDDMLALLVPGTGKTNGEFLFDIKTRLKSFSICCEEHRSWRSMSASPFMTKDINSIAAHGVSHTNSCSLR